MPYTQNKRKPKPKPQKKKAPYNRFAMRHPSASSLVYSLTVAPDVTASRVAFPIGCSLALDAMLYDPRVILHLVERDALLWVENQ